MRGRLGLSLGAAGAALSLGTAAGIAVGPAAGSVVDRIGAIRVAQWSNALSAAGCGLLLVAHGAVAFAVASFALAAGARAFWASFGPMIGAIVEADQRGRWFARLRSLRYAGITAGEALAGAVLLIGTVTGLRILVAGDGVSDVLAFVLFGVTARGVVQRHREPPTRDSASPSYRMVLADGANLVLAGLNVLATLVITAPLMAMPVLVIQQLHLHRWLPGVLAAANTAAIAVPAFFAGHLLRSRSSLSVLALAALLWSGGAAALTIAAGGAGPVYPLLVAGMVILGFGEAAYAPTADLVPLELAPPGLAGRYTAVHQLAWGVSGAVAPILAAVLLSEGKTDLWLSVSALALGLAVSYAGAAAALQQRFETTQLEDS